MPLVTRPTIMAGSVKAAMLSCQCAKEAILFWNSSIAPKQLEQCVAPRGSDRLHSLSHRAASWSMPPSVSSAR